MDETPVIVVLREFNREQDEPLIFSSWRNQSYYSAYKRPDIEPNLFFKHKSYEIENILDGPCHVRIACSKESPITIVGWCVSTGDHLNFMWVKDGFRRTGIGRLLIPAWIRTFTDKLTKHGKKIADKKCLHLQGEENVTRSTSNGHDGCQSP